MQSFPTPLSLLIVSDDWFAVSFLRDLAARSGGFSTILAANDAGAAWSALWRRLELGRPLQVCFIDCDSLGSSARPLVADVRGDPATANLFVCAFSAYEPPAVPGVDFAASARWDEAELTSLFEQLAHHAAIVAHAQDHHAAR